jgi:hypothetical protein
VLIRVRILATGQVIDLIPAAALERLNAGTAVIVEEEKRETFGGTLRRTFESAARFVGGR